MAEDIRFFNYSTTNHQTTTADCTMMLYCLHFVLHAQLLQSERTAFVIHNEYCFVKNKFQVRCTGWGKINYNKINNNLKFV